MRAPDAAAPHADAGAGDGAGTGVDAGTRGWRRGAFPVPGSGPCATVTVRGGPGPRVVMVGRAGDPVAFAALAALALELAPDALAGTCTLVPACALDDPAAGEAFETHALAGADLVLELGAGDPALRWSPAALVHLPPGARRGARAEPGAEAAMVAFGAPESLRLRAGADPAPPASGSGRPDPYPRSAALDAAIDIDLGAPPDDGATIDGPLALAARAARLGVPHVEVRCAAAGERLELLRTGCRNVLVSAGALAVPLELRASRHLELGPCAGPGGAVREIGATVLAGAHGTLAMAVAPGGDVHAGEVLARVHDPARPGAEPAELLAPCGGVLLACRDDGPMAPGDRIALIADEMQP